MIDVKKAVNFAIQAIHDFYDEQELTDLALEEVEQTDDEWLITLGFLVPNKNPVKHNVFSMAVAAANDRQYIRKYKIFAVDAESGKVISMKIREL
jgi:hypothetical protein